MRAWLWLGLCGWGLTLPACRSDCAGNFDCAAGSFCSEQGRCITECFNDQDCLAPLECGENLAQCRPRGLRCGEDGRCVGMVDPVGTGVIADEAPDPGPTALDGYNDPPGSGPIFVIDTLSAAPGNEGFDIDGSCDGGCIDNVFGSVASIANQDIQYGVSAGFALILIELAGLDLPYQGDDDSLTVKVYVGVDSDQPPRAANNFRIPPNGARCCEFSISGNSLNPQTGQALTRLAARVVKGRLEITDPGQTFLPLSFGWAIPELSSLVNVEFQRTLFAGRIRSDLSRIDNGLVGGALPISALAAIPNPYCVSGDRMRPECKGTLPDSSLLDLVISTSGLQPDIDLDADGLECLLDRSLDGLIDRCCDGVGPTPSCQNLKCLGQSKDSALGLSCASQSEFKDGLSVGLRFSAVRAYVDSP